MKRILLTLTTLILILNFTLIAQFGDDKSEPVVTVKPEYDRGRVVLEFEVDPDYHITDLKNGFFVVNIADNEYLDVSSVKFPEGVEYEDEIVFKGSFNVIVNLKAKKKIDKAVEISFKIGYQACQERPQKFCMAPADMLTKAVFDKEFKAVAEKKAVEKSEDKSAGIEEEDDLPLIDRVHAVVQEELKKDGSLLLFGLVFFIGFLTSLTPCVYPVIPIVMGVVGSKAGDSKIKGLYLSIAFVLGLSIVYSGLGILAAGTGSMMGVSFQNPIVVLFIASIFIVMGLSLAGFFTIPVPSSMSSKLQSQKSGIVGAFIIGGISAFIAAPCVGPVLVALLSWISQTGNLFLGFWLTFTFSLGMGVIFVVAGTFSGAISSMPQGGKWMTYVKYTFAILLIGSGIFTLSNVTEPWVTGLLWGIFAISLSIMMGLFEKHDEDEFGSILYKIVTVLIFITGFFLFYKSLETRFYPVAAVQSVTSHEAVKSDLKWYKTVEEGQKAAEGSGKIVMIDTYADWCAACKELDKHTFSDAEVQEEMKKMVLVKLDFTLKNKANEDKRRELGVIGMPTLIFYNDSGKEIGRFSGFKDKKAFLRFVKKLK